MRTWGQTRVRRWVGHWVGKGGDGRVREVGEGEAYAVHDGEGERGVKEPQATAIRNCWHGARKQTKDGPGSLSRDSGAAPGQECLLECLSGRRSN